MTKKFQREEREIDRLLGENKILKQRLKRTEKKLKELNKGYYKFLYTENDTDKEEAFQEARAIAIKICHTCQIGQLKLVLLGNRYYRKCSNEYCDYHTKSKPINALQEKP